MKNWTVGDVMTKPVVSVEETTGYRSIVDLLIDRHISAVPVVDAFRRVTGVVSETDLLRKIEYADGEAPRLFESRRRRGNRGKALARTAADLMSAPAVTVLTGTSIAAAARRMDNEKVKRLPVVDDLGRLVGIVTRGDLLKVHLRPDGDIRADVESHVIRGALTGQDRKVEAKVAGGVVTLAGRVTQASTAEEAGRLARMIPGVVDVVNEIHFDWDDRVILATGYA